MGQEHPPGFGEQLGGLGSHPAGFKRPGAGAVADWEAALVLGAERCLWNSRWDLLLHAGSGSQAEIIPH